MRRNIFGEGEEAEEEEERSKTPVVKKRKVPHLNTTNDDDDDDDYMKYPIEPHSVPTSAARTSLFQSKHKSIGHTMMEKMGFNANTPTLQEPVGASVHLKLDRRGIGAHSAAVMTNEMKNAKYASYVDRLKKAQSQKNLDLEIKALRKLCYDMSGEYEMVLDNTLKPQDTNILWRSYALEQLAKLKLKQHERTRIDTSIAFNPPIQPLQQDEESKSKSMNTRIAGIAEHGTLTSKILRRTVLV
ncbi:uncharacterized protein KQ657_001537 [Scheffersomyces spartinae]|uniref:G-patch domain-containing protein n=1 Tax=Scheffersomyces spartinae TaxID=45513 RepID=A0A9P7V7L6_9ASCO|nr:uncharacterized protein KQ657_001537 [Scheffersomyces spartinae]KAG7192754.1 hypothetical protein KQ657_001537 [Scheffersomyces spartinae]